MALLSDKYPYDATRIGEKTKEAPKEMSVTLTPVTILTRSGDVNDPLVSTDALMMKNASDYTNESVTVWKQVSLNEIVGICQRTSVDQPTIFKGAVPDWMPDADRPGSSATRSNEVPSFLIPTEDSPISRKRQLESSDQEGNWRQFYQELETSPVDDATMSATLALLEFASQKLPSSAPNVSGVTWVQNFHQDMLDKNSNRNGQMGLSPPESSKKLIPRQSDTPSELQQSQEPAINSFEDVLSYARQCNVFKLDD